MQDKKSSIFARFVFALFLVFIPFQASSVPDSSAFYLASSNTAADRCQTRNCMCKVRPGPRPSNPVTIEESTRRYSMYFPTAVHELTTRQESGLHGYLEAMKSLTSTAEVTITAYTDGCGSTYYNRGLALRRLNTATDVVAEYFSVGTTTIHPEAPPECPLPEARRVDIVTHTSRRLTTAIDKIPADVYLVDASGSMWPSWRQWTDIINASYKPGSRIYVSMTSGCRTNQTINSISPYGGTEIWWAYWSVLDLMQPGETLLIISDFDSDIPLRSWEHEMITQKVSQKQVNVVAIRP